MCYGYDSYFFEMMNLKNKSHTKCVTNDKLYTRFKKINWFIYIQKGENILDGLEDCE